MNTGSREISPDVAGQPATLRSMLDFENAVIPALKEAKQTIAEQQRRIDELEAGFDTFVDEITEALEADPIMQAGASPINVSVINGGERYHAGAEPLMVAELGAEVADLKEKLMWPTMPIYKDGKIIGAKRVPPEQLGGSNNAK